MKKFDINELLKQIIIVNSSIKSGDKEKLIKGINYSELTSLEALKVIEGVINYGVLLTEEQLEELPKVDCKKLNTALYLILKYYRIMDIESLDDGLDSMLSINIDSTDGGFYEKDAMAPVSAINDIIEDYASGSRPSEFEDYDLASDEISLYEVKIDYGNKSMIREFERTIFS
ncbi:hypothetical protein [Clostridium sardiniense]|uniref:hypothetical protein n=1 Tax=Clostridium sardiniense TaxID=29369 RepID=UPI003D349B6E